MDIYTENGGIIKTKWNEEFIKNGIIFNKRGLFNKGVSEAEQMEGRVAQEVLRWFLILTGPVSGKESLYQNLWWNHQITYNFEPTGTVLLFL